MTTLIAKLGHKVLPTYPFQKTGLMENKTAG